MREHWYCVPHTLIGRYKSKEASVNLYKFQTVNDYSMSALSELSLYFARTEQLNDPTENMFCLLDPNEHDKYSPDLSILGKMGVLSMAFGDPSKVEESPFMWAHYGNELKGFCLVFDYKLFNESKGDSLVKVGPVKYVNFPRLLSGENLINEGSGLEDVAGVDFKKRNLERIYNTCFFYKPAEFQCEREYRFLSSNSGLKKYKPSTLLSIIIGERMSDKDKDRLITNLNALGFTNKLKLAKTKENSFKIHITQF
ncbi:DUF2971 domain-containing protein [Vibrio parahaemolyticus]|nr:DUF2971 domain-containing protein [Vibrio parahaemolyticus]